MNADSQRSYDVERQHATENGLYASAILVEALRISEDDEGALFLPEHAASMPSREQPSSPASNLGEYAAVHDEYYTRHDPSRRASSRSLACVLKSLVVVLGIAALSLVGSLWAVSIRRNDTQSQGEVYGEPSSASWNSEARLQEIYDFLIDQGLATPSMLLASSSPQARAATWLATQDTTLVDGPLEDNFVQRYSLITFAYGTNVGLWGVIRPWIDAFEDHECRFEGVHCNVNKEVIGLHMDHFNLAGSLPEEIGLLTALKTIRMDDNQIEGALPETLFRLSNLDTLHLYHNDLSSTLSTNFGQLTSLRSVYLGDTQFTGAFPSQAFQKLTNIEAFVLSVSSMTGNVLETIVDWPKLKYLALVSPPTQSDYIPAEIGKLTNLLELSLFGPGLPSQIGSLSNLEVLRFTPTLAREEGMMTTEARFIPTQVGNLVNLRYLSVTGNGALQGTIPHEINQLTSLEYLGVVGTRLTGTLPPELSQMSSLTKLYFQDNPDLTGTIPSEYGEMANQLVVFNIESTEVNGVLPRGFCESGAVVIMHCDQVECSCQDDQCDLFCN